MNRVIEEAAAAVGIELSSAVGEKLLLLADWIRTEAIPAGGVGPNEARSIEQRHLANSLLFAGGWRSPPTACWDLGSGVGLPGLVLALVWPQTRMVLLDSAQRKCDLARRASLVVEVDVEVRRTLIEDLTGPLEAIVSRAAMPAHRFRPILSRLLAPNGVAVISSGRDQTGDGFERVRFPGHEYFDRDSRLLMMRVP